ncbi:hypothetical protein E8E12_004192 [Didymella heteroderae]|uniref:Xylanolytic transcriptional activator regulatory domain-containing protein n=1 Tax=Didymella heteroderae TaxID=1769908 RepID=A0A9P4WXB0_9PLEO|nr:hypothetical protein E8E12_004192 [Didymella heteroderae]
MSTFDISAKSAELNSRENSPDQDDAADKRTSKKRKVLSCYACRSRKMKCDRVYPVQPGLPLTTNGNNTMFTMHDSGVNDGDAKEDSANALRWKMRMQERRIEILELKLTATSSGNHNNSPSQLRDLPTKEPDFAEEMMFRGKGFKTQFHGTSSVMSMISQYRDLQAFTRETLAVDNSMSRVKTDFKGFRNRRKVLMKEKIARTYGTDEEIFALLPPKHEIDIQAALYFRTWETTYRILHEPTFWQEYNSFWQRRDDKQAGFAAILVLVVATTKCSTVKDDVFVGDVSCDRDAASNLIETCEMWLNRQPRKRLTLPYFQLQCLALLAKRVNCVKLKQDWLTAGDVMRLALASGMHRDPSLLATGRISEYEKEMKKRLWYTIAELEIQSSIDSGIQSSLTGLYFDTPAPANLPDEAFLVETKEMPAGRPMDYYTSTSYLITALRSLPLRIHLTKLLNDPSSQLQYTDVLHYHDQISSASSDVPIWTDIRARIPLALLSLQHLQFLLVLHKPYAKMARKEKRFTYSFTSCVETAGLMIDTHADLASEGVLFLSHFRNDVIRVGMTLSQVAALNCARHSVKSTAVPTMHTQTHFADPNIHIADLKEPHVPFMHKGGFAPPSPNLYLAVLPRETLPCTLIKASIDILECTLQLFERKLMRLGTGYMEYWLLSAAVGSSGDRGMDALSGSFDPLEHMSVDLSGWTFPDFWTFDLAGDF